MVYTLQACHWCLLIRWWRYHIRWQKWPPILKVWLCVQSAWGDQDLTGDQAWAGYTDGGLSACTGEHVQKKPSMHSLLSAPSRLYRYHMLFSVLNNAAPYTYIVQCYIVFHIPTFVVFERLIVFHCLSPLRHCMKTGPLLAEGLTLRPSFPLIMWWL